jgi:hypothetical protein
VNVKVDPKLMQALLDSPGVKENVVKMTPEELAWFKELLVKQGIYQRFVLENQKEELKRAWTRGSGKGKRH